MNVKDLLPQFKDAKVVAENVPAEVYLRDPAPRGDAAHVMSSHALRDLWECPERWRNGFRRPESDSTEWGDRVDSILLRPEASRFAVAPRTYPAASKPKGPIDCEKKWNRNATYCKDWEEAKKAEGYEVLTQDEMDELTAANDAIRDDVRLAGLIDCSKKQVMVVGTWVDPETGIEVPLKGLIDLIPPHHHPDCGDYLIDLKTTISAFPRVWEKRVSSFGYHIQAALYLDLHKAATGEGRHGFRHIIQESVPPYQTAKRELSADFIQIGRERYLEALKLYAQCLKMDRWPGYEEIHCRDTIGGWGLTTPRDYMLEAA